MRKRWITVIAAVFVLLMVFAGCKKEPKPLRVCVDMAYVVNLNNTSRDSAMYELEYLLGDYDGLTDIEFEYIPMEGAEREAALDRIRTELMSGGGPDVFLMHCTGGVLNIPLGEALFLQPEKAMQNGIFLPLDKYIANNTKYTEWDKLTQSVMAAGKTEEGQLLIPLTYTVPLLIYRAEDVEHTPSKEITWQNMLEDASLYESAARLGDGLGMRDELDAQGVWFLTEYMLGELADYVAEELCFSEDELQQRVEEIFELKDYTARTDPYSVQNWTEFSLGAGMNCDMFVSDMNGIREGEELTLIPLYSDDGGCTAMILTYAAVNSNTRRPEDAFKVIDRLLRKESQQAQPIYLTDIYRCGGYSSMPMHEEVMQESCPIKKNAATHSGVYYSARTFENVCAVRDSITHVQFAGEYGLVLREMMMACNRARSDGKEYKSIVSETYNVLELMIAE